MDRHLLITAGVFIISLLVFLAPSIFISPLFLAIPIMITLGYYFYPVYKERKENANELDISFIFSIVLASYSYIYKDVFNSFLLAIRALKDRKSGFINKVKETVWFSVVGKRSFEKGLEEVNKINPYFSDFVSLVRNSLREKERSLEGIKKSLSYLGDRIFSLKLKRASSSVNPIRIVFSILVVLPVFLLILLPLTVLFLNELINAINLSLVFNVIIPLTAFGALEFFSVYLVLKPRFYDLKNPKILYLVLFGVVGLLIAIGSSIYLNNSLATLAVFLIYSLLFFGIVFVFYRDDFRDLEKKYEMLEKFPALFTVLAKYIAQGTTFERALIEAEKKEGVRLNAKMFLLGKDSLRLEKALSSYHYFLEILREAARKNIIEEISEVVNHYFKLRKEVEDKIMFINEELYHSAKLLLILIIPLISGVSAAFSDSLENVLGLFKFENLEFVNVNLDVSFLSLILSLYTIEMSFILTLFYVKLEGKRDWLYILVELSKNFVVAVTVLLLSYVGSYYFINLTVGGL